MKRRAYIFGQKLNHHKLMCGVLASRRALSLSETLPRKRSQREICNYQVDGFLW